MQEKNSPPLCVELAVQIDELARFSECSLDRQRATYKELIRQKNHFFLFVIERLGNTFFRTLKEIGSAEFYRLKTELLAKRPYKSCEFWEENGMNYKLKCRSHCKWKAYVDVKRCFFLNRHDNQNNKVYLAYQEAIQNGIQLNPNTVSPAKKDRSSHLMRLSEAYGIDYDNVSCLGTDPKVLKSFQQSYQQALDAVPTLSPVRQYEFFKNLSLGSSYSALKDTVKQLCIDCGSVDLRQMNFSKLIFALKEQLDIHRRHCLDMAIERALNLTPDERRQLCERLEKLEKKDKAEKIAILTDLGIEVDALDIKKFDILPLKNALIHSLD